QVEDRCAALDDSAADGREVLPHRELCDHARVLHPLDRRVERRKSAGDRRGARATIGLQDVAVERDGALPDLAHVDSGAEGAADQALNLMCPATHATLDRL